MRHAIFAVLLLSAACGRGVPDNAPVVVAGDSVMAWNRGGGASVANALSARLGVTVGDVSLPYAQILSGRGALNIPSQVSGVSAPWVVLNGGANDIGISCQGGVPTVDRLISGDGTRGPIPELVSKLRARGSRVVWADYYTSPRFAGRPCPAYEQLELRLSRMAAQDAGILFVDMGDVIASGDLTLFDRDRTHPSPEASALIAAQIARAMRRGGFSR